MQDLPTECRVNIARFTPLANLAILAQTCKEWKNIIYGLPVFHAAEKMRSMAAEGAEDEAEKKANIPLEERLFCAALSLAESRLLTLHFESSAFGAFLKEHGVEWDVLEGTRGLSGENPKQAGFVTVRLAGCEPIRVLVACGENDRQRSLDTTMSISTPTMVVLHWWSVGGSCVKQWKQGFWSQLANSLPMDEYVAAFAPGIAHQTRSVQAVHFVCQFSRSIDTCFTRWLEAEGPMDGLESDATAFGSDVPKSVGRELWSQLVAVTQKLGHGESKALLRFIRGSLAQFAIVDAPAYVDGLRGDDCEAAAAVIDELAACMQVVDGEGQFVSVGEYDVRQEACGIALLRSTDERVLEVRVTNEGTDSYDDYRPASSIVDVRLAGNEAWTTLWVRERLMDDDYDYYYREVLHERGVSIWESVVGQVGARLGAVIMAVLVAGSVPLFVQARMDEGICVVASPGESLQMAYHWGRLGDGYDIKMEVQGAVGWTPPGGMPASS